MPQIWLQRERQIVYQPEALIENDCHNRWDLSAQTNHIIEARRLDLFRDKENSKCQLIDFAVPCMIQKWAEMKLERLKNARMGPGSWRNMGNDFWGNSCSNEFIYSTGDSQENGIINYSRSPPVQEQNFHWRHHNYNSLSFFFLSFRIILIHRNVSIWWD